MFATNGAKGIATRSKDATNGAPGITTRSNVRYERSKGHRYHPCNMLFKSGLYRVVLPSSVLLILWSSSRIGDRGAGERTARCLSDLPGGRFLGSALGSLRRVFGSCSKYLRKVFRPSKPVQVVGEPKGVFSVSVGYIYISCIRYSIWMSGPCSVRICGWICFFWMELLPPNHWKS